MDCDLLLEALFSKLYISHPNSKDYVSNLYNLKNNLINLKLSYSNNEENKYDKNISDMFSKLSIDFTNSIDIDISFIENKLQLYKTIMVKNITHFKPDMFNHLGKIINIKVCHFNKNIFAFIIFDDIVNIYNLPNSSYASYDKFREIVSSYNNGVSPYLKFLTISYDNWKYFDDKYSHSSISII